MNKLISDLFNGELSPIHLKMKPESNYAAHEWEAKRIQKHLLETLTGDELSDFQKLIDLNMFFLTMKEEAQFIQGFKMGAQLFIEVLSKENEFFWEE